MILTFVMIAGLVLSLCRVLTSRPRTTLERYLMLIFAVFILCRFVFKLYWAMLRQVQENERKAA